MELTREDALRAYATSVNSLSTKPLEGILAEDCIYESQEVIAPLASTREECLAYLRNKYVLLVEANAPAFAEMGSILAYGERQPCVVLAQYHRENLVALVLAKVSGNKLVRLDVCIIPPPEYAQRSGEYPNAGQPRIFVARDGIATVVTEGDGYYRVQ